MESRRKSDKKFNYDFEETEVTERDVMNLLIVNKTAIKDIGYAAKHVRIEKKLIRTTFKVIVKDIDGKIHVFQMEVKMYR